MRIVFDRGTLLLTERGADAGSLPGVVWDPRVRAWRAPAFAWRALRSGPDAISEKLGPRRPWPAPLLRPYQARALEAWRLAKGRGLVCLPTGAGKTRVGVAAIAHTGLPALVLVPTRVLLHQWVAALDDVCPDEVGVLGDGQRRIRRVTVSTFESAWRRMDQLGDRFGLLVVDEAHHFGLGQRDEALEMSVAPFRLGLTATPPEDPGSLPLLVGPVVTQLSVDDLAGTWLASYQRLELALDLTDAERAAYERDMATFRLVHRPFMAGAPNASWPDFARAASRSNDGRRALAAIRRARRLLAYPTAKARALRALLGQHASSRVLVFTANNETAYRIAREELIMPITCDIAKGERESALARFRDGTLRALVSSRVLNEGLDVPDAEVAIVVGSTRGAREHIQRIGRVLRPAEGKRALVYELITRRTNEVYQAMRRSESFAA